jgi:hypothetical protein
LTSLTRPHKSQFNFKYKGVSCYFLLEHCKYDEKNSRVGIEPELCFEYDESFKTTIKNNPNTITEILEWVENSDEYKEICDYAYACDWDGDPYNNNETFESIPDDFLRKLQTNKYISDENKSDIEYVLHCRLNKIKEPKKKKVLDGKKKQGYIYLVKSCGLYKIGRNVEKGNRFKVFETTMPVEVESIHSFYSEDYIKSETLLHKKFSLLRQKGEWFNLSSEDVEYICSIGDHELP